MGTLKKIVIIVLLAVFGCKNNTDEIKPDLLAQTVLIEQNINIPDDYIANKFDYPVGKPNAKNYYNAQVFGENHHLGDDWNSVKGGNSDFGDPIYAIANGYISVSEDFGGGWGNVVRIIHQLPDGTQIESLYAHCDAIMVNQNDLVRIGQKIGTIGTANGQYYAHLHLEIRNKIDMPLGNGYSKNREGYLDPTEFIKTHRVIKK